MRTLLTFVFFALATHSLGCAYLIGSRGINFEDLDTKDKVHSQFGPPTSSVVEGENTVETFRTRQKLMSLDRYGCTFIYYGMGWGASFGTIDLILVPSELYRWSSGLLLGTDVQVTYHNRDVRSLVVNGKEWLLFNRLHSEKKSGPVESEKPE